MESWEYGEINLLVIKRYYKHYNLAGIFGGIYTIEDRFKRMETVNLDPFKEFFNKMNKDLKGWLNNEQNTQELL